MRPARRQHGRPVRRLVGRLARPARRHHARHHHPPGDREGRRRGTARLTRRTPRAPRRPTSWSRSSAKIPYAEGSGDRAKLELGAAGPGADRRRQAQRQAAGRGADLAGGRSILGDVLDAADAVVAAWLPGTEGDGVADVLFGAFKPTGKLSCLVAGQDMSQIPINVGDPALRAAVPVRLGLSLVSWRAAGAFVGGAGAGRRTEAGHSRTLRRHAPRHGAAMRTHTESRRLDLPQGRARQRRKPEEAWLPATVPGLRAHRPARGRQDRRSVLPAEREGPAVDRKRVVGVPHDRRGRRGDAGARARRAGVRRASTRSPRCS